MSTLKRHEPSTFAERFMADGDFDKGVAVKVSLPSSLVDGLQIVCDAAGISKSDATKAAIEAYLNTSPLWVNRRYFFPDLSSNFQKNFKENLKNFRTGTFVKLAGGISHFPTSAQFFIGVVHRVQGEKLYVELPMYLSRPTALLNNAFDIKNQISIAAEAIMVVPRIEHIPNLAAWGGTTTMFMYEVHTSFIWSIEMEPSR